MAKPSLRERMQRGRPPRRAPLGRRTRNRGGVIALYVTLGVLFVVGIGVMVWLTSGDDSSGPGVDRAAVAGDVPTDEERVEIDEDARDDPPNPGEVYPERSDQLPNDRERQVGEEVRMLDYEVAVTAIRGLEELGPDEKVGYIEAAVEITNVGGGDRPYGPFDWYIRTPEDFERGPTDTSEDTLENGTLAPGDTVEGRVIFEVGRTRGEYFLAYQPATAQAGRVFWRHAL